MPAEVVLLPTVETLQGCAATEERGAPPRPAAEEAEPSAERVTPATVDALIERMPELGTWPRHEVERLASDLLRTEAQTNAERQHRDPTDDTH